MRTKQSRPVNGYPFCHLIYGLCLLILAEWLTPASAAGAENQWVHLDNQGRLKYALLPMGDHIMDFSTAGYMGGGVKIPLVPVRKTVSPSGGDDTAAIQGALDEVSRLEPQDGFRGAVLLEPGIYHCRQTLFIRTGGVVLRGSGSGTDGSIIELTGPPHLCFNLGHPAEPKPIGRAVAMTDPYVPSGGSSFHIREGAGFQAGDPVLIYRPATPAWVRFMGMDTLYRRGRTEHWVSGELHTERTIKSVAGNLITLAVPLSDSFDARYLNPPGGSIAKYDPASRPMQIGVESLRLVSPPQAVTIAQPQNQALRMDGASDSWVRDLKVLNTVNSFYFGDQTSRLTVEDVDIQHAVPTIGAAEPEDFWAGGTQTLINRCSATGDNVFYFSTGARMMGPVVVLNCVFHGGGHIEPHMRWATGLLLDNCSVPQSGINLMNRGIMGSGHGWAIGWSVAWNCTAKNFLIQSPPGSMNWAIGCRGEFLTGSQPGDASKTKLPEGTIDSPGTRVSPDSLYLEQLRERLGPEALANIGY